MMKAGAALTSAMICLMNLTFSTAALADQAILFEKNPRFAQADQPQKSLPNANDMKKEASPVEKMQARFPQSARVDHLIGLPVLDDADSTLGFVQQVVRTGDGKIKLIVPFANRLGWLRDGGWFAPSRRPIAVPIEVVAILALQIVSIDMDRRAFISSPTWTAGQAEALAGSETIKIALGRR